MWAGGDVKPSRQSEVWRIKCVLSLKNPRLKEIWPLLKGNKTNVIPQDNDNLECVGGRKQL